MINLNENKIHMDNILSDFNEESIESQIFYKLRNEKLNITKNKNFVENNYDYLINLNHNKKLN